MQQVWRKLGQLKDLRRSAVYGCCKRELLVHRSFTKFQAIDLRLYRSSLERQELERVWEATVRDVL